MQKTVYFVRHGQTEYNRKHIIQGRGVDSDLNEKGRNQAKLLYQAYSDIDFELVICSSLKRTEQTLHHFIDSGLPKENTADLDEIGWGEHEGKRATKKMKRDFDKMLVEWKSGNFDACLQGGESLNELKSRVERIIKQIEAKDESSIIVCSHGRTLMCLVCMLAGESLTQMWRFSQSNTAVNKCQFDGTSWTVETVGDTSHLKMEEEHG